MALSGYIRPTTKEQCRPGLKLSQFAIDLHLLCSQLGKHRSIAAPVGLGHQRANLTLPVFQPPPFERVKRILHLLGHRLIRVRAGVAMIVMLLQRKCQQNARRLIGCL